LCISSIFLSFQILNLASLLDLHLFHYFEQFPGFLYISLLHISNYDHRLNQHFHIFLIKVMFLNGYTRDLKFDIYHLYHYLHYTVFALRISYKSIVLHVNLHGNLCLHLLLTVHPNNHHGHALLLSSMLTL
jgi:hypothetical protein